MFRLKCECHGLSFTYGYNTWTKPVQVAAVGIAVKDDK